MSDGTPMDMGGYLDAVKEASSEAEIESAVSYLLKDFMRDQNVRIAQQVTLPKSKQRVDILAGTTLIEVKRGRLFGSDLHSAKKQVKRYLSHLSDNSKGHKWKGLLTNGMAWHSFKLEGKSSLTEVGHFDLSKKPFQADFYAWLQAQTDGHQELAPPPRELSRFLDEHFNEIKSLLAENEKEYPLGITIKKTLWYNLLSAGHIVTDRDDTEMFATHTMLVLVAKIVCKSKELRAKVVNGEFDDSAIKDVVGDGFTSWLLDVHDPERCGNIVLGLVRLILAFDWNSTEQDILKVLYHDLIPNKVRHEFGEFYTPDWLAKKLVDDMMPRKWCLEQLNAAHQYVRTRDKTLLDGKGMLDPACGSGTFLFHAAKRLLRFADDAWDDNLKADIISQLVIGIDIHPIAVEMARATLLTALPAMPAGGEAMLRIFMGDTLMSWGDELVGKENGLEIKAWDGLVLHFPEDSFNDFRKILNELVITSRQEEFNAQTLRSILQTYKFKSPRTVDILLDTAQALWTLNQSNADHIWQWYAENLYNISDLRKRKVGMICGNPPWVVYNSMAQDRQREFRDLCKSRELWQGKEVATQHDLASLFSAVAVDYFLLPGRKFTFVLPYSALRGKQWQNFRTGKWGNGASNIVVDFKPRPWDLSDTRAFPTKSCVIFGQRLPKPRVVREFPMPLLLQIDDDGKITMSEAAKGFPVSPSLAYQAEFVNGATLFPHCLLFPAEYEEREEFSYITSMRTSSKGKWKQIRFRGKFWVETGHLAKVTLSNTLLPFMVGEPVPVLLPLSKVGNQITSDASKYHGDCFRGYWADANAKWEKIANKDKKGISFYERIDYVSQLSKQLGVAGTTSHKKTKVIYSASGSVFMASRVAGKRLVDKTLYWANFSTADEAAYITAMLNSPCLQKAIRASRQSDRDFMAWPLKSIPFPKFDPGDRNHMGLARLCKDAERRVNGMKLDRVRGNASLVIEQLTLAGILDRVDSTVRILLPEHTT